MCKTVNLPEGPSERLLLNASFLPQLLRVDGSKGHPKTREFLEVGRRDSGSIPQPGFLFRSMLTCARTCVFTVRRAPVTITNQARMPMKPLTGGNNHTPIHSRSLSDGKGRKTAAKVAALAT